MKILFYLPTPGGLTGAPRRLLTLALAMKRAGHHVCIVSDSDSELLRGADVIEHLADPDRLIDYLKKRCAPGGLIVFSTPDRAALRGAETLYSSQPDHVREWTSEEFRKYLLSRGLKVLEQRLDFPVKLGFNTLLLREALKQLAQRRSVRYNQLCLVTPIP